MKKRIIIAVIFFSFNLLNAQTIRQIEMKNQFITPEPNTYYKLPNMVHCTFSCKNIGLDSLFPGDTIKHTLMLQGRIGQTKKYVVRNLMIPGDSLVLADSIEFDDPPPNNPKGTSPMIIVGFRVDADVNSSKNLLNNGSAADSVRARVDLDWKASYNSINSFGENKIVLYPNPGSGLLNIQNLESNLILVRFYDLHGKLCEELATNGENAVDTKKLKIGLYLVEIQLADGSKVIKKWLKE